MIDIISVSKAATLSKSKYPDTINASIGMFYDETGKIGGIPYVRNFLKNINADSILPYASMDGGQLFRNNVISWVLRDYEKDIRDAMFVDSFATLGGSGSISTTFSIYGNPGDAILVSDNRWQYERFAEVAKLNIFEHELFDGDAFNLKDFELKLDALTKKQKQVIVVLNDPCHNPTGYTLSISEFEKIVQILNKYTQNQIVFLYDIAYLEYDFNESREKFKFIPELKPHVLTILAFSGSKTFGIYGFRMGASIAISKDESKIKDFYNYMIKTVRGYWSSSPTIGIELFNTVVDNPKPFLDDLNVILDVSKKRAKLFIFEAKEAGLETLPFRNGFYIMVASKNPLKDYEKLLLHRIFVIPLEHGLRVALSSLSLEDIKGLPRKIKNILGDS